MPRFAAALLPIAALAVALSAVASTVAAAPRSSSAAFDAAPDPAPWRSAGRVHTRANPPGDAAFGATDGGPAPPVVFLLPDDIWDARRAWPYLDQLASLGIAVVELWPEQDQHLTLADAQAAIAAATDELGLDPSRVALLGFGAGGRMALALATRDKPAVALYPACEGAPALDREARVMVLHPDEAPEARACAALTAGRPGARSARASVGAGHAWDVVGEQTDGRMLLPHPGEPAALSRRLPAYPDVWATFRAARTASHFLLNNVSAHLPSAAAAAP